MFCCDIKRMWTLDIQLTSSVDIHMSSSVGRTALSTFTLGKTLTSKSISPSNPDKVNLLTLAGGVQKQTNPSSPASTGVRCPCEQDQLCTCWEACASKKGKKQSLQSYNVSWNFENVEFQVSLTCGGPFWKMLPVTNSKMRTPWRGASCNSEASCDGTTRKKG